MATVRRLVTLGRSARTEAKVKVRQPLARALIVVPASEAEDLAELEALVAEELNVKELEHVGGLGELVTYSVKPNFKTLGPRFGKRVKDVGAALAASDAHDIVRMIEETGSARLNVDGEEVVLEPDDLDVRVEGREGFSLAQDGPYGVALDLHLTQELIAEGIAREVVRGVQDLRKSSGLAVEDRIELWMSSDDEHATNALSLHRGFIAAETLATTIHVDEPVADDVASAEVEVDGAVVRIALRKA
jgi:isoleucyl-tRNA synthetase